MLYLYTIFLHLSTMLGAFTQKMSSRGRFSEKTFVRSWTEAVEELLPLGLGLICCTLFELPQELLLLLGQVGGGFYHQGHELITPRTAVEIGDTFAPETDSGACLGSFTDGLGRAAVESGDLDLRA